MSPHTVEGITEVQKKAAINRTWRPTLNALLQVGYGPVVVAVCRLYDEPQVNLSEAVVRPTIKHLQTDLVNWFLDLKGYSSK